MPIALKPLLRAACSVVPLPANGSRMVPLGGVISVTNHSMSVIGLTVLGGVLNSSTPHLLEVVANIRRDFSHRKVSHDSLL